MTDTQLPKNDEELQNPDFREKLAEEVFMIYGGSWGNALGTADQLLKIVKARDTKMLEQAQPKGTGEGETLDDDKFYKEVEYAVTSEYKAPNGESAKSRIDRIMRLHLQDREQYAREAVREARVEEIKLIESICTASNGKVNAFQLSNRLTQLTNKDSPATKEKL